MPEGEVRLLAVINTGQTENGFFAAEITPQRMRLGYQVKIDAAVVDQPQWEWMYLLDQPLAPPGAKSTA